MSMLKTGFIYQIVNDVDNLRYIGSTTMAKLNRRWHCHMVSSRGGTNKLYKHMRAIGLEHFRIEKLEECSYGEKNELFKREAFFIKEFDTIARGLNNNMPLGMIEESQTSGDVAYQRAYGKLWRESHPTYMSEYAKKIREKRNTLDGEPPSP